MGDGECLYLVGGLSIAMFGYQGICMTYCLTCGSQTGIVSHVWNPVFEFV